MPPLPAHLARLEAELWEAADQLRANSRLNATEDSMPVLGLIFLRHATNRFDAVRREVEAALPTRGGVRRPLAKDDLAPKDRERVKAVAVALLGRAKAELARIDGWRTRGQSTARVRQFIYDYLCDGAFVHALVAVALVRRNYG